MNVGVFGGTFDPIHVAHLFVAEAARESAGLDRVWFLPSFRPPHKNPDELTSFVHRLAMTRLAVEGHPAFEVSDIESRSSDPSYTTHTLELLQREYPDWNWFLILGEDSLCELHTWKDPQVLCRQARFIVFPRPHADRSRVDRQFLDNSVFLDLPELDISATDLRKRIREARSVRYLVPDRVRVYIAQEGLYR